ncbi:ferrochelatase [bacterium]|nr:ferrochelatase [bacterium]
MKGILLINLGTPDAPTTPAVKKYLREFLMDPQVIDINPIGRWLLVNGIIAPFRSPKSAAQYQSIWTNEGSPLVVHSQKLAQKVQTYLGDTFAVSLGMRYGNPSIENALNELLQKKITSLTVLPLYPQYALSSTQSSLDEVNRLIKKLKVTIPVNFKEAFFHHPLFIKAFSEVGGPYFLSTKPDHVIFSFHGLPERHLKKLEPKNEAYCLTRDNCCDLPGVRLKTCYRAQSVATAKMLAVSLGLKPEQYTICFQSRLGRTPWIKPYTDVVIQELAKRGVKKLLVFSPSFVADCLETLEEMSIRNRELFLQHGGEDLVLVPSLNDHPRWVECVGQMVS